MRVELASEFSEPGELIEVPWESADHATNFVDLRENAAAIERIEPARRLPPLRNFLTAINSADSVLASARSRTWDEPANPAGGAEEHGFASRVDVFFAPEHFNFELRRYQDLIEQLQELLTREASSDAICARLAVLPCRYGAAARNGFCLRIALIARGTSGEQAQIRWGLGLARVQQALLFISRVIRQHIAQDS